MLLECFPTIGNSAAVKALRAFLNSVWFIVLIALLMACANLFSWELPVFYVYLVLGAFIVLLCDDLKGVIPIACCAYMTLSYENNPAVSMETSAFYKPEFVVQFVFILAVAVILLIGRLVTVFMRGEKKKVPALALGFGALGLSFVLGGLFSEYYGFRTAFFGFVVIASLCGLYFFFYYGVDWKKTEKDYFAYLFLIIGLFLLAELLGMYLKSGILTDDSLDRGVLITGWGMYNNVGCVLCACLPAPLYLALEKRRGWIYTALSLVLVIGLVFTQSRGSMLFGAPVFLAGMIIVLVKSKKRERIAHFIVLGVALVSAAVVAAVFYNKLIELFSDIIEKFQSGDIANGRMQIYKQGIEHFLSQPVFGVGFYQCNAFRWGHLTAESFLPPRYHNTIIQVLASGGIFSLLCYLVHRVETLVLICHRPSREKTFLALSVAGILLTSLVECHLFSFGPALLYGVLLVFAEGRDLAQE